MSSRAKGRKEGREDVTVEREKAAARARHPAGRLLVTRDWDAEATWLARLPAGPETDAKRIEWLDARAAARVAEAAE